MQVKDQEKDFKFLKEKYRIKFIFEGKIEDTAIYMYIYCCNVTSLPFVHSQKSQQI